MAEAGRIICNENTHLVVAVSDDAQMTCPTWELDWQLRYGNANSHRFTAASALESYEYLVFHCTKEEAWRRIKLMRRALSQRAAAQGQGS
jgi:hypothetical protein